MAGSIARDQLFGGASDDRLGGRENSDVLVGGAGRDRLTGGFEGDVFRFDALTDSYRTATAAHTDLLVDFTSYEDRLDLTALGISGFGDGHNGTLKAYYNAAQDVTYLKNFDADDQGRRFELQLSGDQSRLSNPAIFVRAVSGTSEADSLKGGNAHESLFGGQGADVLNGGGGEDRLFGDSGGDRLAGGEGADTFVYRALSDSLRDTLAGFGDRDQIDLRGLGFTGLGDGHNGSLKLSYRADLGTTYLQDLDPDAQGARFELKLLGDYSTSADSTNVLFS